jgi:hypothetical protein
MKVNFISINPYQTTQILRFILNSHIRSDRVQEKTFIQGHIQLFYRLVGDFTNL